MNCNWQLRRHFKINFHHLLPSPYDFRMHKIKPHSQIPFKTKSSFFIYVYHFHPIYVCFFLLHFFSWHLGDPNMLLQNGEEKKHLQKLLALIHHFISETKVSSLMWNTTWLDLLSASLLRASLYSTWNIWKSYVYVVWTFSSLVNEYIPFHWKSVQNPKTWMWTVF